MYDKAAGSRQNFHIGENKRNSKPEVLQVIIRYHYEVSFYGQIVDNISVHPDSDMSSDIGHYVAYGYR